MTLRLNISDANITRALIVDLLVRDEKRMVHLVYWNSYSIPYKFPWNMCGYKN